MIDHRVEKEKQILKGVGKKKKKIGGARIKSANKKQGTSRNTGRSRGGATSTRQAQKQYSELLVPSAEKKDGLDQLDGTEEEQNASYREKQ